MATYTEEGQHLTLRELNIQMNKNQINKYLSKISRRYRYFIPDYPRPEIQATHLSHSTDLKGLKGISKDKEFKGFRDPNMASGLVWFSLAVTREELCAAETRNMKIVRPGGIEDDFPPGVKKVDKGLLTKFASSPAFSSRSMYGSYRFTFDLQHVLDRYREQFCGGEVPVMRKWKTVVYKQEVTYAVLVHSPSDENFSQYPLLEETQDPRPICEFRDGQKPHFIWRPQAMSEKHRFKLKTEDNRLFASKKLYHKQQEFYVWDNVALALVVGEKVLSFQSEDLRRSLWFCEKGFRPVKLRTVFQSHEDADRAVRGLWPNSESLRKFATSDFHIFPPN